MKASMVWKGAVLSVALLIGGGPLLAAPAEGGEKQQRQNKADKPGQDRDHEGEKHDDDDKSKQERRAERYERIYQQLFKDIELSKEEDTRVRAIMKEAHEQRKAWREAHKDELRDIRREMRDARRSDDKEAGEAAHEKLRALMEDAPHHDGVPDKLREVLSDTQIEQYQANVKELRKRWHERHEKRQAEKRDKKDEKKKPAPKKDAASDDTNDD